jgi:ferrous iron transport protein B
MNILLMGNPNVGKSVVFSRLTGTSVISSNYPGTTVEFSKGKMHLDETPTGGKEETVEIIDVPGVYTIEKPSSKAEEVAAEMLSDGDVIIDIVNATNLERSLNLTLQLVKRKLPFIIALNLWDEAQHLGIKIDVEELEKIFGVPCIPTCAITGEGFKELVSHIKDAAPSSLEYDEEDRWNEIGRIVRKVEKITHRHHGFKDRLSDASISPLFGIPIAVLVLYACFWVIRFIGEGLVGYVFTPLFNHFWAPVLLKISAWLGGTGFIHDLLIGKLVDGGIDFATSFGLLSTALFVPIGAVFPYVCAFYLVLSFLEDSGYLPRLAVLVDNIMHRMGVHGSAIMPMMLGLGCNVPGVLSTRIMETKRERFIAATLMSISIPCVAQIGMIAGLLGEHGPLGLGIVFGTLFLVWVILGLIMNKVLKGQSMEIFIEIPPYRFPVIRVLLKKLWMRIIWFFKDAIPWVIGGVFIANLLYMSGIIKFTGNLFAPVISGILGLPKDAVGALLIGFLRKDVAVGMLAPLNLSLPQLIVASVTLTMYFPCVATFATLIRELGIVSMLKSALIMVLSTLIVGGLLNLILRFSL